MRYLNEHPLFDWAILAGAFPAEAVSPEESKDFAKVCVGAESFWIRDVVQVQGDTYSGKISNELVLSDVHGLHFDDEVSFTLRPR